MVCIKSTRYLYYPGCTIKRDALEYEESSLALLKRMGVQVKELDKWYCCGSLFSLATDDLMSHIGGVRTLIEAQKLIEKSNFDELLTLCPMCYNVLKRINLTLKGDPSKLETLSAYMNEEDRYRVSVKVVHIVEVLAKNVDKLKGLVVNKLDGFKVAVYYGCMVLRPKEVAIDNPENPQVVESLLNALGVTTVNYPFKTECCGSYHVLLNKDIVSDKVGMIISSILRSGANVIVMVCPLCLYNFKQVIEGDLRMRDKVSVVYLSELLAHLVGVEGKWGKLFKFKVH